MNYSRMNVAQLDEIIIRLGLVHNSDMVKKDKITLIKSFQEQVEETQEEIKQEEEVEQVEILRNIYTNPVRIMRLDITLKPNDCINKSLLTDDEVEVYKDILV